MISSTEMCRRTGATYRQLDYWTRNGVVTPAQEPRLSGPGGRRAFSERQIRVVRLIRGLAALGATQHVLTRASLAADLIPECEWFGTIYVDTDGDLTMTPPAAPAWSIDLAVCADRSDDPPRQLVLT